MKFLVHAIFRFLLPIAVLAGGWYGYSVLSLVPPEEEHEPAEDQMIRSRVHALAMGDYEVNIETNGIVGPHNPVTLSSEVTGTIRSTEMSFEVGSFFKKGDRLLQIDDRDYRTSLQIAEEQHRLAKATSQLAQTAHDRMVKLADRNSASSAELDATFAALVQARSQVEITASAIEQAERNLQRTRIDAPFDGRVATKSIGVGQLVSPGTMLGDVFAIDFAEVRLPIASRELRHIKLPERDGDATVKVELRDAIDRNSGARWPASIVRTEGALDADSLELFAIARIEDPFSLHSNRAVLRIGQPVIASIQGQTLKQVMVIPRRAVRRLDQVHLIDPGKLTLRTLTIDPLWSDSENVIVRDTSIEEGELLATTQLVYAPEGSPVEIIADDEVTDSLAGQPPELKATP